MIRIKLAGLNVIINNKYTHLEKQCRGYLSDFEKADIEVYVTDEEIDRERTVDKHGFSYGYYESVCAYRKICHLLPLYDRLMLHSAVVEKDGNAVAFCGRSGIGKSTHVINLYENFQDVQILNGDKPIIHINNDTVTVYGTPWQGKENLGKNNSAVLSRICFLEQADNDRIEHMSNSSALSLLLNQFVTPTTPLAAAKHLELIDRLISNVEFYKMYCTANKTAAVLSYNKFFKKELL